MPIVSSMTGQVLDDVYVIEVDSASSITGVATGIVGMVGFFQQGIPTAIYTLADYSTAVRHFGKSTVDIGGPIAIQNLVRQGAGEIKVVPCFGDGAAAASYTLYDSQTTPAEMGTITAAREHPQTGIMTELYGTKPNAMTIKITSPSTANDTFNMTITASSSLTETYTGLSPDTWADTINADSSIVIVTLPDSPSTNLPAAGTYSFSGGSCGTLSTTAEKDAALIGDTDEDTGNKTGLALLATTIVNLVFGAEYYSDTFNSELVDFASDHYCIAAVCIKPKATVEVTESAAEAISEDNVVFCDGWCVLYDSDLDTNRNCAPTALVIGMASALDPQKSWGNKKLKSIVSLVTPRTRSELAELQSAGALCIHNAIPRGGNGTRSGVASDGSEIYVRRMRYYLEFSIMDSMGWAVDELQSTQSDDVLRGDIKSTINTFLEGLVDDSVIDSYLVTCDLTNNTSSTIAAGKLYVTVKVRLLAAAKYIIISIEASTSTVTTSSTTSSS